ncbi:hypothetical protein DMO24_11260 [Modestobacter versicolor]|uniref:Uncharacterized protein n=1 Tax=Modestobacter versicolor TaxID=429133 RepID=A0A323VDC7_9ACTN|nr:hypothetical protein DMO24_11260 [Modestobacter versicolor]
MVVAVAVLLALAGCEDEATVCPASAAVVLPNVVVQLERWPAADSAVLQCAPACVPGLAGDDRTELTVPVVDGVAGFDVFASPATVAVTVLAADGTELTRLETELDWARVGGSEECGGPVVATVDVPG